ILYYLAGYLFTLVAAFMIINLVTREGEGEDIACLAGLNKRSPFLAFALALCAVSLAGIPPLAGFFGKFLLVKSVAAKAFGDAGYFALLAVAVFGVVVSIYYYFGIIRAIYWSKDTSVDSPVSVAWPTRIALGLCVAAILYLGLLPDKPINWANAAAKVGAVAD
ncbi:MAG: proton-conducting transporter membrane subunit, partial [Verrucomicrobiota bacterium]|nr:proton-conducting transporter membrane subunit [Verrucomicrobiota bacterium]